MNRRHILGAIAGCLSACQLTSRAAPVAKVHRIGVLCSGETVPYFWEQLRGLGYEEHRNVEYVFKDIDVSGDQPGFAAELAKADVDVIVACSNDDAMAAMRATSRIPIVLLYGVVPVEAGLVASLARPGGNVTGSAAISTDLASKSIEIFKSAMPDLRKLSVLVNLERPVGRILHAETERAAKELGIAVTTWQVHDSPGLSRTFAELARNRPDGVIVSVSVYEYIPEIIEFAARQRLPAMYPFAPAVRSGGLMAYSPNWLPQSERNAQIVDRILKGAHPRDIPVEQPLQYAFGINLKTARALSLPIPPSVMLRATWFVE